MIYTFSEYLEKKYGEKVYKLPVNLPFTCPNRDGTRGTGGCAFCGEEGAGFECLSSSLPVEEQLRINAELIHARYKAKKYIAYFQNYTNTYTDAHTLKKNLESACRDDVVALYISTRPDCLPDTHIDVLSQVQQIWDRDVVVEVGLQTANYHTLKALNRCHGLAEFIDAVIRLKKAGLGVCAHCITDLPMDDLHDVTETARILSALHVDQVKCHSLYILKDTVLGTLYEAGGFQPLTFSDYVTRIIAFIEHLDKNIAVQRIAGRAPDDRSLFCNWGMSWWRMKDAVELKMMKDGNFQGRLCDFS
ncbi:MAG TPA: TIGR01212 family radical SAM protein [Clostridiales bacterium]|nr:TIGR01212 family radical SAM protein [Clostridiales bacterium]